MTCHVVEPPGDGQIFRFAGQAVEIGQRLVHAAVLVAQHRLHLLVAEPAVAGDHPIGDFLQTSRACRLPQWT